MRGFIVILFIFSFLFPAGGIAQSIQYADSVEVSLLTCEPGKAVYARFGHSALRIRDAVGRDMSYNYGIFDFRTEHFYWKFLRGKTDYLLGAYPTEYFLEEYRERKSAVWEQVLNLTTAEKKKLIDLLNENYLPENRMYRYNFVYDNCATRPKVMVQNALDGVLNYNSAYSSDSYRQLISGFIADDAWLHLGINLVFGAQAEQKATRMGAAFLPVLLRNDLQHATVTGKPGETNGRQLVKNTVRIVGPFANTTKSTPWWMHPIFFSCIWLGWGILLSLKKQKRSFQSKSFDSVLYAVTALAGILIFMLSFFSDHPLVAANWNLLWLNPFNILPAILIWKRSARNFLTFYHAVNVLLMLVAIAVFALQVQVVPVAVFPILLLLLIRTTRRLRRLLKRLLENSTTGFKWKN